MVLFACKGCPAPIWPKHGVRKSRQHVPPPPHRQRAVNPPSMGSATPVTKLASSDASHSAASATSPGLTRRPIGTAPTIFASFAAASAGSPLRPVKPAFIGVSARDRKSGVEGKGVSVRVDLGGRRSIKKKQQKEQH